jgi:hypothetical protein
MREHILEQLLVLSEVVLDLSSSIEGEKLIYNSLSNFWQFILTSSTLSESFHLPNFGSNLSRIQCKMSAKELAMIEDISNFF